LVVIDLSALDLQNPPRPWLLQDLFRKTGTNRQSELVRMASRAVGGLRVDDDEPGGRQDR
jgi:hypothetical protein